MSTSMSYSRGGKSVTTWEDSVYPSQSKSTRKVLEINLPRKCLTSLLKRRMSFCKGRKKVFNCLTIHRKSIPWNVFLPRFVTYVEICDLIPREDPERLSPLLSSWVWNPHNHSLFTLVVTRDPWSYFGLCLKFLSIKTFTLLLSMSLKVHTSSFYKSFFISLHPQMTSLERPPRNLQWCPWW